MIQIKKGLNIPIQGIPDQQITTGNLIKTVALVGEDYIGMKPVMEIAKGDQVRAGEVLFRHKRTEQIQYTAPVSGKIVAINRGQKRVLQSVVIERNEEEGRTFTTWSFEQLAALTREEVIQQLTESGLWCALRARPFSKIPDPKTAPHSLFVTAMDTRPLAADPAVIIKAYQADFSSGLEVLKHLTAGELYLCTAPNAGFPSGPAEQVTFSGPHPAGLPGTHIHFVDPVSVNKTVWHINYQDVIAIGKLFTTGHLWQERIISLAGPQVKNPRLIKTVPGACLNEIVAGELTEAENRVISGSVLSGRQADSKAVDFLGRYDNQVSVLEEGRERTFLHYLRLGLKRFSVMPVYLSYLFKQKFAMTTTTNGSPRAMVPVGSYERIMPLDILPTQLLRALIVGDTEMAHQLGALELDEEDLALCTFVCPGKYEYGSVLRDNLRRIEEEG
ncbi:MAG: Na(+)-translocating NADH-quinone reductase subunit A [Endozoicomonadaceae bacterium]|nr:Na(+)-translocating NADH-quinone reductase subunit A [Endozoicomonadaceae bacterium]